MIHCNHQKEIIGMARYQSILTGSVLVANGMQPEGAVGERVIQIAALLQIPCTILKLAKRMQSPAK